MIKYFRDGHVDEDPNNPVLWIRNDYFPDPDPTVPDPTSIFSIFNPPSKTVL